MYVDSLLTDQDHWTGAAAAQYLTCSTLCMRFHAFAAAWQLWMAKQVPVMHQRLNCSYMFLLPLLLPLLLSPASGVQVMEVLELPRATALELLVDHGGDAQAVILSVFGV
jgi:hypothetical protein